MITDNENIEGNAEALKTAPPTDQDLYKVFCVMLKMLNCSRRRGKKEDSAGLIIPKQSLQEFPKGAALCADWDDVLKAWIFYVQDSAKHDRQIITRPKKLLLQKLLLPSGN